MALRVWAALIGVALVLPGGGCGGCGCSRRDQSTQRWGGMSREEWLKQKAERDAAEKKEEQEARRREEERAAARRAEQQQKMELARQQREAEQAKRLAAEQHRTATLPPPPALDDDVGAWGDHDFWLARSLADRRLIEALARRAAKPLGTAAEAELFGSLLPPVGEGSRFARRTGSDRDFVAATMRATAAALVANATSEARQILRGMIHERAGAEDSPAAADGALEALIRSRVEWADALVMECLVSSSSDSGLHGATPGLWDGPMPVDDESRRPGQQGSSAIPVVQQRILARIQRSGGPDLRARLARTLAEGTPSAAWRARVQAILMEDRAENLDAQAILYRQPWLEPTHRRALELLFTRRSAAALEELLGVAPPGVLHDADHSRRVAANLWSDEFARLVELRERAGSRLAENGPLLIFASTSPSAAMRLAARRAIARHWLEGCGALAAVEMAKPELCDPGFLVSLKTVWRDERPRQTGRTEGGRRPGGPTGAKKAGASGASGNALGSAGDGSAAASESWLRWAESLLRAWCNRCHEAGLRDAEGGVGQTAGGGSGADAHDSPAVGGKASAGKTPENGLPVAPSGATVLSRAERVLSAPPGGATSDSPLPPSCVRFVRYELRSTLAQAVEHYRRSLRGTEEHTLSDGTWLDAVQRTQYDDDVTVRSVDVLVRRRLAGRFGQSDAPEPLVVDVLVIETIEQSPPAAEEAAASARAGFARP